MKSVGEDIHGVSHGAVEEAVMGAYSAYGVADVVYNSVVLAVFPVRGALEQTLTELKDG